MQLDVEKIRLLLKKKGCTPFDIVKKSNVSQNMIYRLFENRVKDPRLRLVVEIAKFLDVKIEDIIKK